MQFEKLVAVIPLSRIDPDPDDLTDRIAEATLGSYQVLWHPVLLSRSRTMPAWARAEDPPLGEPGVLVVVPEASRRLLASGWEDDARARGARVIAGEEARARFLARLWDELPELGQAAANLDADAFLTLGLARLWLEMLGGYLRHATTLDADHFQREVLAAASAAVLKDDATAANQLDAAFRLLEQARDCMYGADVRLLDLCLVDPRAGLGRLDEQLALGTPLNLFMSGRTAEEFAARYPDTAQALRAALDENRADILGGDFEEVDTTILPLASHAWQLMRGDRAYRSAFGRGARSYGRRRFGLAPYVVQLINRSEMASVAHFSFDDGAYPTPREPKIRWEGPDTSTTEALTRIPFAADRAVEYLRFPHRVWKTMMADHTATVSLVHWPMPETVWYGELTRLASRTRLVGRFCTLGDYFSSTDPTSVSTRLRADDYASPFLVDAHRRRDVHPVSGVAARHAARARLDNTRWMSMVDRLLGRGAARGADGLDWVEELLERSDATAEDALAGAEQAANGSLGELICPAQSGDGSGTLLINPLGQERRVFVPQPVLPDGPEGTIPRAAGASDVVAVDVPAMGFSWLAADAAPGAVPGGGAIVDGWILRNERLDIEIDAETGGVRSIADRMTGESQAGQQLVLVGIPPGRDLSYDPAPGGGGYGTKEDAPRSRMRASSSRVLRSGPDLVELVVEGELIAEPCPSWANEPRMARFRQGYQLGRDQDRLTVDIELFDLHPSVLPVESDPWRAYVASRLAWPDSRSVLVRGVGFVSEATQAERPETPWFIEVHGRRHRVALLTGGLPYHQRVGSRMLDTLLVTATERGTRFRLAIGLDLSNPFHAALELVTPPVMIADRSGPPAAAPAGWFFHLDARNVVIASARLLDGDRAGARFLLFESAGRATRAALRCLYDVASARVTDWRGQFVTSLYPEGDTVPIDLMPHELAQVDVVFA